jgi:hypothetical protein
MLLGMYDCSYSDMGSGLVRGVCLSGDSGSGMREGVISLSNGDLLERVALSLRCDLRNHWLFDFCQAGGAHGPSDSASDSISSCGTLHRDECIFERALYAELCMLVLRSGSNASSDALSEGMSES